MSSLAQGLLRICTKTWPGPYLSDTLTELAHCLLCLLGDVVLVITPNSLNFPTKEPLHLCSSCPVSRPPLAFSLNSISEVSEPTFPDPQFPRPQENLILAEAELGVNQESYENGVNM